MPVDVELEPKKLGELAVKGTEQVFELMVGIPIEAGETAVHEKLHAFDGVVAMVTFTGDWVGAGMICFDEELACVVGSKMLMTEVPQVDADVLDGVGELANMILGNFKETIEPQTGPLSLSIPTVIYGKNFLARAGVHAPWVVAPFRSGEHSFEVWVSIQAV